jgi:pimeloyl-ACP methyl ester carboxylesterase
MPKFAEDAEAALDWLRDHRKPSKCALLGHSVGAAAVLLAASRRQDVDAVISVSSFAHPEWLMSRQFSRIPVLKPLTKPLLRYVEWVIGHRFKDIAPVQTVKQIRCPVLLVHGTEDETIPVECLEAIAESAGGQSPVEVLLIPDAGHASVDKIRSHAGELLAFFEKAGFSGHRAPGQLGASGLEPERG